MAVALITGASSGLGQEFARQLAHRGHDLVLVARSREVLEQIAEELHAHTGVTVEVLVADLSQEEDVARVASRVDVGGPDAKETTLRPVSLLVNNAGYALGTPFPDNDLATELAGLEVMVRAVMVLSHHALSSMRHRRRGAILNVGSVACETGAGTYSAHKAWIRAFTEGLSAEMEGTGVSATCVMPGLTRTSFFEHAGVNMPDLPEWVWLTKEQVVRDSLQAVRQGKTLVTPHLTYKAAMTAMRIAPRWLTRSVVSRLPHM